MITDEPNNTLTDDEKDWVATAKWVNRISQYILVFTVLFLTGVFLIVFLKIPSGKIYIGEKHGDFQGVTMGDTLKIMVSKFETTEVFKAIERRMFSGKSDMVSFIIDALKRKIFRIFGL